HAAVEVRRAAVRVGTGEDDGAGAGLGETTGAAEDSGNGATLEGVGRGGERAAGPDDRAAGKGDGADGVVVDAQVQCSALDGDASGGGQRVVPAGGQPPAGDRRSPGVGVGVVEGDDPAGLLVERGRAGQDGVDRSAADTIARAGQDPSARGVDDAAAKEAD